MEVSLALRAQLLWCKVLKNLPPKTSSTRNIGAAAQQRSASFHDMTNIIIRQTVDKEPIDVIGVPCHALHERTRLFGRIEADGQSLHGGENLDFYIIYDSRHYTAHKELERHGHKQSQKLHADNCADKISERDETLLNTSSKSVFVLICGIAIFMAVLISIAVTISAIWSL